MKMAPTPKSYGDKEMIMQPKSGDLNHSSADKDMMGGSERPAVAKVSPTYGNDVMVGTKGPSHMGMGNIADTTNSHQVPAREEMKTSPVGSGLPGTINHSGADRQSKLADPKKWHKKGYSKETPSTVSGKLAKKWEM